MMPPQFSFLATLLCITAHVPWAVSMYYNWQPLRPQVMRSPFQPFSQSMMNLNNACSMQRPSDVLRMLPGRFLSDDDLLSMVPEPHILSRTRRPTFTALRRVIMGSFSSNSPFKTGNVSYINDGLCGCCLTEIGYEVIETVTDFQGRNHTLINFNNNFQFIPTGRCSNEDAPCGGGGRARCKQVTRAHWSLAWTPGVGAQLIAHEVPSHCQCLNIGTTGSNPPTTG
ncbi:uncharacterized protein LOC124146985 [Haliotis rufescens]|uniref:uncharacterized protein LOC124146985 n=1 Tax=Haliotis rufescens TaxID=6454 RepID=UPI001EAFD718|nr:uncharacterized protein LOC124146985 [Haliotis rufescens]